MRIISKFKEPYDSFMSQDPKVVYERTEKDLCYFQLFSTPKTRGQLNTNPKVKEMVKDFNGNMIRLNKDLVTIANELNWQFKDVYERFKIYFYAVANKLFVELAESFYSPTKKTLEIFEITEKGIVGLPRPRELSQLDFSVMFKTLRKFQLATKVPVLRFDVNIFNINVTANSRLSETRIYSLLPLQTAFQEISMLVAEIQNQTEVPVKITDKDRITQHGFDLKQSFRHRM